MKEQILIFLSLSIPNEISYVFEAFLISSISRMEEGKYGRGFECILNLGIRVLMFL